MLIAYVFNVGKRLNESKLPTIYFHFALIECFFLFHLHVYFEKKAKKVTVSGI